MNEDTQRSKRGGAISRPLIASVRFYQNAISPLFLPRCRYYPSCSAYAVEALQIHGAGRGSWLAARRLGRCHPWTPGGVDHVPGMVREEHDGGEYHPDLDPDRHSDGDQHDDQYPVSSIAVAHHRN